MSPSARRTTYGTATTPRRRIRRSATRRWTALVVSLVAITAAAGLQATTALAAPGDFTNKTTTNGLGNNIVNGVYASGSTVYAATAGGLSISTDGGTTFTNKTTGNGLGSNSVYGVYASGSMVYAATQGGLSISTDGGTSFTNTTTGNGLGSNSVYGVYASGSTVYAATGNGLAISIDGGTTFTNKTFANTSGGLGNNNVSKVYAIGSTVYAATRGGLSISTNGGTNFTNYTSGLGNNIVNGVYAIGSSVYAATAGGLAISTNGGTSFTNKTTANGLGNDNMNGVYASGSMVYTATQGGLSISTNGGTSFTNYTSGLGGNLVFGVYAIGSTVYAATIGGLSIGFIPTSPGVLSGVAAAPGNTTASVSWTVDDTGGSAVTSIEFALDDTVTVDDSTTNITGPHTLSGLVNGQAYTVYARAVNSIGTGPWSTGTSVTPQAPSPPIPPRPAPAMTPTSQTITGTAGTPITATSAFTLENFTLIPRYTVYPALPAGLTIDPATGVVTGTPIEAYPSTRHWITATAGGNSESAYSTLQVTIDPAPEPPPTPTITIVGSRSANGARIEVTGTSTHLTGATLTPWFQLAGQAAYTQGKITVTVASDGTFTWSRKANKRTSVYITHGDVKSNTVVIAAR